MRSSRAIQALAMTALLLSASSAFAESPQNPEEVQLEQTESNVLQVQRALFAARQKGDEKEIRRLEKKFKKLQDERARLLRATWQM